MRGRRMSDSRRDSHSGASSPRASTTLSPLLGTSPRSDHPLSPPVPAFGGAAHPGVQATASTPLLGTMAQRNTLVPAPAAAALAPMPAAPQVQAPAALAQMPPPGLNIQAPNNPPPLAMAPVPVPPPGPGAGFVAIPIPGAPAAAAAPAQRSYLTVGAQIVTHASDAAAAGLSLSDAFAAQTPYVRSMTSGASWAASGLASGVANRREQTAANVVADAFNTLAGGASMAATGLQTDHQTASSASSYVSNALWVGAGVATMYSGKQKFSAAPGWFHRDTLSGGLQMASGLANTVAGAAGAASTYFSETSGVADPRAVTASVVSGAAWVAGSVLGAASTLASR